MNKKANNVHSVLSQMEESDPEGYKFIQDLQQFNGNTGFTGKLLECKNCQHRFSREDANIWLKVANQMGNEKAIKEFKRLSENE